MSTPRGYTSFPSSADLFYFCTTSSTSEEDLNLHYAPPSKSSLRVGVLILGPHQVQLLDLAVVDMLANIGRNRIAHLNAPARVVDRAVDEIDIRYVSESGEGSFPITSGARMPVTNSFEDAPPFDVLVIPGSFTSSELSASALAFLTAQSSHAGLLAVMCIASGIHQVAQTGILRQKRCTGPPSLLPSLRQRFPEAGWVELPWTRHDELWSSGSAITALDMAAAWLREYFWDRSEVIECALAASGIAPLDAYDE